MCMSFRAGEWGNPKEPLGVGATESRDIAVRSCRTFLLLDVSTKVPQIPREGEDPSHNHFHFQPGLLVEEGSCCRTSRDMTRILAHVLASLQQLVSALLILTMRGAPVHISMPIKQFKRPRPCSTLAGKHKRFGLW